MCYELPIKSVLIFKWRWCIARSMDELEARLREKMFYVVKPQDNVIVATSLTNPSMILFVIIKRSDKGGDIVVIQNPGGWYSDEDIVEHMPLFGKCAGIEILYE